jgi:hypothetical protein
LKQADNNLASLDRESDFTSNDHWMRRAAIMTLLSGMGAIACGWNISELDQDLGRKIALSGSGVAFFGTVIWFITHHILKGYRNAES